MKKILGILNCTPDSFYDGKKDFTAEERICAGLHLAHLGADALDIGGESTRPFSTGVDEKTELQRVLPVILALKKQLNIPLSIDTKKSTVAKEAIAAGATIVNDVTGLQCPAMRRLIAETKSTAIVMHMQNNPETMQQNPSYPQGVVAELLDWFQKRLETIHMEGISKEQIIIDPGIGFGKSVDDNLAIVQNLSTFASLGYPVMIGLSRKSFIQKILGKGASEVLSTTIALNTISLLAGASLIRVHDVEEHRQVVDLLNYWKAIEV